MPGKCRFNGDWKLKTEYVVWLDDVHGDNCKAYCKLCNKKFDISSMGEAAIKVHSKGWFQFYIICY